MTPSPDSVSRPPAVPETSNPTPAPAKRVYFCDRCGSRMSEYLCKITCPNCGNRFDCSDLNIYFD